MEWHEQAETSSYPLESKEKYETAISGNLFTMTSAEIYIESVYSWKRRADEAKTQGQNYFSFGRFCLFFFLQELKRMKS